MSVNHYENFPVASFLLPARFRPAVAAIYHFARGADDVVDEGQHSADARRSALAPYYAALERMAQGAPEITLQFSALSAVVKAHDLPLPLLRDLLDAFSQDIVKTHYADEAELLDYCRRSANPIGRLLLRLYRAESAQQLRWSDSICTALQLINHWQDVAVDLKKPRVYIPQTLLLKHGVSSAQLEAGQIDSHWHALMRELLGQAQLMMLSGAPLARTLPGRIGLELRLVVCGGLRILEKIDAVNGDIFRYRPQLTLLDWPVIAWRALFAYPRRS